MLFIFHRHNEHTLASHSVPFVYDSYVALSLFSACTSLWAACLLSTKQGQWEKSKPTLTQKQMEMYFKRVTERCMGSVPIIVGVIFLIIGFLESLEKLVVSNSTEKWIPGLRLKTVNVCKRQSEVYASIEREVTHGADADFHISRTHK